MKEDLKQEDLDREVKVKIDKDAFKGPLKCNNCNVKMTLLKTSMDLPDADITLHFQVYRCSKCNREYLSGDQAKKLDKLLEFENVIKDKTLKFERVLNFDGQSFFVRFPNELTKTWTKDLKTEIKALSSTDFFIHIQKK